MVYDCKTVVQLAEKASGDGRRLKHHVICQISKRDPCVMTDIAEVAGRAVEFKMWCVIVNHRSSGVTSRGVADVMAIAWNDEWRWRLASM